MTPSKPEFKIGQRVYVRSTLHSFVRADRAGQPCIVQSCAYSFSLDQWHYVVLFMDGEVQTRSTYTLTDTKELPDG